MSNEFDKRIINYIRNGNLETIETLLEIQFLKPYDILFESNRNTNPEDGITLIGVLARYPCVNYKQMINLLLRYGAEINDEGTYGDTPLETAMIYRNFPTAAYLQFKGGNYERSLIDQYNTISDANLYTQLKNEFDKINEPVAL
jgi:ankyrin repeat protein